MKAVIPVIDETREKSYYLQVYDYIKKAVLNGEITEGEKLPSLQESLAKSTRSQRDDDRAVPTTSFSVEGYIYSRAQSGYYVEPGLLRYSNRRLLPAKDDTVSSQALSASIDQDRCANYSGPSQIRSGLLRFQQMEKMHEQGHDGIHPRSLFFAERPAGRNLVPADTEIARYLYVSQRCNMLPSTRSSSVRAPSRSRTTCATILREKWASSTSLSRTPGYRACAATLSATGAFAITSCGCRPTAASSIEKLPDEYTGRPRMSALRTTCSPAP